MLKLIKKIFHFFIFSFILLELYVRIFHLYDDVPKFIIKQNNLLSYKPNQRGLYNFGNRKEIESKYSINNSGFNSSINYEFNNSINKISLIGDSYIEGFHQNVNNSIGRKIEKFSPYLCYEYGISDWNLNDYFNLISTYQKEFVQFKYIFINLNQSDLEYSLNDYLKNNKAKLKVEKQNTFLYEYIYTKVKLFSSINQMGFFEKIRGKFKFFKKNTKMELDDPYVHLNNFLSIKDYFIKKEFENKIVYIINSNSNYQESFLHYLYNYNYIDLSTSFNQSNKSPYFLFDKHWNNIGRDIVSYKISEHINKSK